MAAAKPATLPRKSVPSVKTQSQDDVMLQTIDKLLSQGVDPAVVQQMANVAFKRAGMPDAPTTPNREGEIATPWYNNPAIINQDALKAVQGINWQDPNASRMAELAPEMAPSQTHPDPTQGGPSWIESLLAGITGGAGQAPPPFGPSGPGSGPPVGPMGMPMPGAAPAPGVSPTDMSTGSNYPETINPARPDPTGNPPAPMQGPAAAPTPTVQTQPQAPDVPAGATKEEQRQMTDAQKEKPWKDWDWEDLLMFSLNVMAASEPAPGATRTPSLAGIIGRAGAASLANKQGQRAEGVKQGQKQQEIDLAGAKIMVDAETARILNESTIADRQLNRALQAASLGVDAQQAITQIYKERDVKLKDALTKAALNAPEGVDVSQYQQQIIQTINAEADQQIQNILRSTSPFSGQGPAPAQPRVPGAAADGGAVPGASSGVSNVPAAGGTPSFAINQKTGGVSAIRLPDGQLLVPNNH